MIEKTLIIKGTPLQIGIRVFKVLTGDIEDNVVDDNIETETERGNEGFKEEKDDQLKARWQNKKEIIQRIREINAKIEEVIEEEDETAAEELRNKEKTYIPPKVLYILRRLNIKSV